jgi:NAD(P)-dependent dehydrogenase (short-subunit alcohol dehydrogenase family)
MAALQGTAIVVGVGSEQSLGAALSRRFAREAYNVIVSRRTEAKLARVIRSIIDDGGIRCGGKHFNVGNYALNGVNPPRHAWN